MSSPSMMAGTRRRRGLAGAVALLACSFGSVACEVVADPTANPFPPASAGPGCDQCTPLAQNQSNPTALAVDATAVYWIDRGATWNEESVGGSIMKAAFDGSAPVVLDTGLVSPEGLVIDATSVYWVTPAAIMKVNKDGTGGAIVASGLVQAGLLATDDTSIYWISLAEGTETSEGGPTLFRAAKDGTGATRLATFTSPIALAVDGSGVYVVDATALTRVAKDTGDTHLVTQDPGLDGASHLVLDKTHAYWVYGEGQSEPGVFRVGKNGGEPTAIVSMMYGLRGLAVDGTSAYWTTTATDPSDEVTEVATIWKIAASGGDPTPIASMSLPAGRPWWAGWTGWLSMTGEHIYATGLQMAEDDVAGLGEVMEVPK